MSDPGTIMSYGTQAAPRPTTPAGAAGPLLQVRDLRTWFPIKRGLFSDTVGQVKAVDGVTFDIHPSKTLGLVGESGCGKTTVGRTILRLIPATGGTVFFKGENFFNYQGEALRRLRRHMQIVFQDPVSSLNPRMTVGGIIGEPIEVHGIATGSARQDMVASLLSRVGLDPTYARRYPHEFSGGQRQRIGIARAFRFRPTSSSATSRSARWTYRSRRRSSTFWKTFSRSGTSPTSSSRTTWRWCSIFRMKWR